VFLQGDEFCLDGHGADKLTDLFGSGIKKRDKLTNLHEFPIMCCFHAFVCKALRADIERVKSVSCPVVIPGHSYYNFLYDKLTPTTLARCLRSAYNPRILSLSSCFSFPRSIVDYIVSSHKFLYLPPSFKLLPACD
jgi:hypothetical protein